MPLNERQRRFVAEYLIDLNATAAAKRAGYSEKGASVRGTELLANRKVKEAVDNAIAERAATTGLTAEGVLTDLHRLQMKAETDGQFSPAVRAAQLRGQHLQLFTEKIDLNVGGSVTHELRRGRKRVAGAKRPES